MNRCLMPLLLSMLALFAGPRLAQADDKPKAKPDSLSPKEIADGWILLFDGETTFGWKTEGEVQVRDGVLTFGGKQASSAVFNTEFGEYELKVAAEAGQGRIAFVRGGFTSSVSFSDRPRRLNFQVKAAAGKSSTQTAAKPGADGVEEVSAIVALPGPSRIRLEADEGKKAAIRSLKLRPIGARPLFNGKDLSGWQVTKTAPKRLATRFTVTPQGELAAKNGPGDLRTEDQFDDFVLQFECKTNGKALNSGFFFRCMPNAYQNGYEAQIQNAYLLDRTKPLDYGTGAIYRRVKARKVVSNDQEWFTMTVAARGPHIATWVNGYPTVDWTDNREANDNPRKGLRTAKGHISIQGHDPTTNLLFRNIRIVELSK